MSDDELAPAGAPAGPGLKVRLEQKLGLLGELKLVGYRGHGTARSLHVKGRLLESTAEAGSPRDGGGVLRNALTTLRRMHSDEIAGARLMARFRERQYELYTDEEGYFQLNLYVDEPLEAGWHAVHIDLVASVKPGARAHAVAESLVPSENADFAVVSDLDDTVIESSATDKLEQARLTLLRDAASRVPFDAVGVLYRALARGSDGRELNPIFYLSRSGWNLYDLFVDFMNVHDIPPGPMFLRDLAFLEIKSPSLGSAYHKLAHIRDLLQLYPTLPFVLVGDSGQHDAERYRQIAIEYPGRIRAVYLRDVTGRRRKRELDAIARDLRRRGVPTLLADDTRAFAEHMHGEGLVTDDALADVRTAAAER